MDFLKTARSRTSWSYALYVALNVALALVLLAVIRYTDALWLAFLVVLISKWRVLAVRPRYWLANFQANLVDIIVSVGLVIGLSFVQESSAGDSATLAVQSLMVLMYIGWLLWLKPKSRRIYIVLQAAAALLVGTTALFLVVYDWSAVIIVMFMWLIGYATAKHVLTNYEETQATLLSIAWGLFLAEIGWLLHHWTIAYRLPLVNDLMFPQASIVVVGIGFLAYKAYDSYHRHEKVRFSDIMLPLIFVTSLVGIILLAFNDINTF
jgi:hypothetical protein